MLHSLLYNMTKQALKIIIFLLVLSLQLKAQINLVPNYSFEEKDSCPTFHYELTPTCKEWFDPVSKMFIPPPPPFQPIYGLMGSGTYFHKCGGPQVGVPNSLSGNQYPLTGDAYAGFVVVTQDSALLIINQLHDYIEVELIESLNRNTKYYAEFYYSLAELYSNGTPNYFLNNLKFVELGMLFTDTLVRRASGITMPQPQNICATAQVSQMMGPQIDTVNWIKVSGSFTAKGGEKFLTIGSFIDLDTLIGDVYTFIFIDDVSVCYCGPDTTLPPDSMIIPNIFTPNGDGINDKFTYKNQEQWAFETQVFNRWGELVFDNKMSENWDGTIKGNPASSGVYFYMIKATAIKNGKIRVYKGTVTVMY